MIGFIGLVVPHLLRPLVGDHPVYLLPASALDGACFLLMADIVTRMMFINRDLKLGVVTGTPELVITQEHLKELLNIEADIRNVGWR